MKTHQNDWENPQVVGINKQPFEFEYVKHPGA